MFDTNSRYYKLAQGTLNLAGPDGQPRTLRYVLRRFIPPPESMTTLVEHQVQQGERLDNLTARYLSDPTLFWRVCDANDVMSPEELERVGRLVRIAMATQ